MVPLVIIMGWVTVFFFDWGKKEALVSCFSTFSPLWKFAAPAVFPSFLVWFADDVWARKTLCPIDWAHGPIPGIFSYIYIRGVSKGSLCYLRHHNMLKKNLSKRWEREFGNPEEEGLGQRPKVRRYKSYIQWAAVQPGLLVRGNMLEDTSMKMVEFWGTVGTI